MARVKYVDMDNPFKMAMAQTLSKIEGQDSGSYHKKGKSQGEPYSKIKDRKITLSGAENEAALKSISKDTPSNHWQNNYGVAEAALDFFDKLDGKFNGQINLKRARANLFSQDAKSLIKAYFQELAFNAEEMEKSLLTSKTEVLEPQKSAIFQTALDLTEMASMLEIFLTISTD